MSRPLVADATPDAAIDVTTSPRGSGGVAERYVSGQRRVGDDIPGWEYAVLPQAELVGDVRPEDAHRVLEASLTRLGEQGWELVSVEGNTFIFKRSL